MLGCNAVVLKRNRCVERHKIVRKVNAIHAGRHFSRSFPQCGPCDKGLSATLAPGLIHESDTVGDTVEQFESPQILTGELVTSL